MNSKKRYYDLDDIGFIGTQEPIPAEQQAKDNAAVHAYIEQQKAKQTPEEKEYYSAFGSLLQAIDRYRQAKRKMRRMTTT